MDEKNKGHNGNHHATLSTYYQSNFAQKPSRRKAFIVTLTIWGLVPVALAEWLIERYCKRSLP